MSDEKDTAVHLHPLWRSRANFIIAAAITGLPGARWEQLWARQVADDEFEICCIPFFVYDLGPGDIVQTQPSEERTYVVSRVLFDAGLYVFRVWFGYIEDEALRHAVMDEVESRLAELGCERERHSHDMLAVAIEREGAQAVADYLQDQERATGIEFETGRTRQFRSGR